MFFRKHGYVLYVCVCLRNTKVGASVIVSGATAICDHRPQLEIGYCQRMRQASYVWS